MRKPPTLVLAIDQAEELFQAEAQAEALRFLLLMRELLTVDSPELVAIFTIRSDNYERLQECKELEGTGRHSEGAVRPRADAQVLLCGRGPRAVAPAGRNVP